MITDPEIYEQKKNAIVIDVSCDQGGVTLSLTNGFGDFYVDAFASCIVDDEDDFDRDEFDKELLPWLDKLGIEYTKDRCDDIFIDRKNVNKLVKLIKAGGKQ